MKIVVLTTSYPPTGGTFVAALVELARGSGVEVVVVDLQRFEHFGLAGGHGILGNLRARPWLALAIPFFLWNFRRAALRETRNADLVHAHWLVTALVAATLRRPFVVHVWGTDVELGFRAPGIAQALLRRARLTIAPSEYLARRARALGARDVCVVPAPISVRSPVSEPLDPPHVLYVGRLSAEKGIAEFLAATEGLPRVIVGSGPVEVAEAVGSVSPGEVNAYYERAAVVVVPSRREGYGMVAREAMAHARPVVATAVGGLQDAIQDGVNGVLVPPCDVEALREAIAALLEDVGRRTRLGMAARAYVESELVPHAVAPALIGAYRAALRS